ncbi:hypothetical protein FQZ97_580100 [compost metagenome]
MTVPGSAEARPARSAVGGSSRSRSASLGVAKLKIEVRSPQTARRHGEMFGSATPKRRSMKRSTEVWSNTCELTQPPLVQGDSTYIGTRGPSPYTPCRCAGVSSFSAPLTISWYSPAVSTVDAPASVPEGSREGGAGGGM